MRKKIRSRKNKGVANIFRNTYPYLASTMNVIAGSSDGIGMITPNEDDETSTLDKIKKSILNTIYHEKKIKKI